MNKRVIAAVVAVVLALVGIVAVVLYVKGAQDRAFAGKQTVPVLRVTEEIPAGTKASAIGDKVESVKLPRAALPDGVVGSLDELGSKSATATLVPGEVLVKARFGTSGSVTADGDIAVPKGLQEVTIQMDSARMLGGLIKPGDRVGVLASYDQPKTEVPTTNFVANKVLVLGLGGGVVSGDDAVAAGSGPMQVRLAMNSDAVEKTVNAAEFGKVWLSRQGEGSTTGRNVITPAEVVK